MHQAHGRADGAGRQDHFAAGRDVDGPGADLQPHADGAALLQVDPDQLGAGQDVEVGPPPHVGAEERAGRAPALAVLDIVVVAPDAFLLGPVEVGVERVAGLHPRLDEGVEQRIGAGGRAHRQLAARAVEFAGAAVVRLGLAEGLQHLVVGPVAQPHLRPAVVVQPVAAGVDHAVDRRGAAQHPPARPGDAAAVQMRLGLGGEAPVAVAPGEQAPGHDRHAEHRVPVAGARLDQQHAAATVGRQPVGQYASGRAGAHDDDVVATGHQRRFAPGRAPEGLAPEGLARPGLAPPGLGLGFGLCLGRAQPGL